MYWYIKWSFSYYKQGFLFVILIDLILIVDLETITLRQDAVSELTEKEEVFYNLQTVISRFLDVDHLLSLCVQIPKQETVKTAESKLTNIIYLKHTIELVEPFHEALRDCENPLLKTYYKSLEDPRFQLISEKLSNVISEDTRYKCTSFNIIPCRVEGSKLTN